MTRDATHSRPVPTGASRAAVSAYAEQVAGLLRLSPRAPVGPVVTGLGGRVEWRNAASYGDEVPESLVVRDHRDFTVLMGTVTTDAHDRSVTAEALGHLFLHYPMALEASPGLPMRATRWVGADDVALLRARCEAIWFGMALLMPEGAFREAAASDPDEGRLARAFDVTASVAGRRKRALGLA